MENILKEIKSIFAKFDGDKEKEGYLILDFFKKQNIDISADDDTHKMMYLYLCSLVDIILQNSSPEYEFLTDEESDFVESIEDMIEFLEV
jgi:hypothetical protein